MSKKKKKCKFCNEYKKYLQHYYKFGEKYVEIKVSYCPVCGRKL